MTLVAYLCFNSILRQKLENNPFDSCPGYGDGAVHLDAPGSKGKLSRMIESHRDWKKLERLYAEILTHIQVVVRGNRNPALHGLEKKYDERDAHHMLTMVEEIYTTSR